MTLTPKERLLLLVLAAIQFTNVLDFMIIMPLGPQLMRLFHIGPKQFGLLVSAYMLSAGLIGIFAAFFVDRFDRKKVLTVAYAGFTVGTLACGFAPTYHFLLVTRILTGMFGGMLTSTILSIVGDAISPDRRGRAMGIVMAGFSVASVVGVPFGLFLASMNTWHAPFYFLGGMAAGVSALIYFLIPNMNTHIHQQHETPLAIIRHILQSPNQVRALCLTAFLVMGQFTVIPFISPSLVANVGFTEHQLTYVYLLGGAVGIFTGPFIGKLADKYGKKRVFQISILLSLIPIAIMTNLGKTPIALVLVVTTFFFVVMGGRMIPAMAMITGTVSPQRRGSFMSINSAVLQLFSGIASFVAGLIIKKSSATGQLLHYPHVGLIAVICSLACIGIARAIRTEE